MSISYSLIYEGSCITALIKNIEIPENLNSIGFGPSFMQRGSETKLKFENCIISTISDIFYKYSPNVTNIEINNSVVDRIDMKVLKNFKKLVEFNFINSTLNEFVDTVFGGLRNFTLKFETDAATNETIVATVDGKINFDDLEQKDDENGG